MTEDMSSVQPDSAAEGIARLEEHENDGQDVPKASTLSDPEPNSSSNLTQPLQEARDRCKSPNDHSQPNNVDSNQSIIQNLEIQLQKSKRDLESMVLKYAKSERENLQNQTKVDELDKKLKRAIKDNDQLANRIKLLNKEKTHLTDALNAKVAQLTVLEQKNSYLSNAQGVKLREYEEKIKILEVSNEDLRKQIESYKSNEGELLDFSERLSMKHMMLQSELEEALKKVPDYKDLYDRAVEDKNNLTQRDSELLEQIKQLTDTLEKEREYSKSLKAASEENEIKYRYSLDELQNEIKVLRRKHQMATKELMKEMKQLREQMNMNVIVT